MRIEILSYDEIGIIGLYLQLVKRVNVIHYLNNSCLRTLVRI